MIIFCEHSFSSSDYSEAGIAELLYVAKHPMESVDSGRGKTARNSYLELNERI